MHVRSSRAVFLCCGLWLAGAMGAAQSIECGDTIAGDIDTVGEIAEYSVPVSAAGTLAFTIVDIDETDPGFEAICALYDTNDVYMGEGDYGLVIACPVPGTYTLRVADQGSSRRGTYALNLQAVSESLVCGPPIACGETLSAPLGAVGEVHAYSVAVPAPGTLALTIVDVTETDPGFEALCELYAPDGSYMGVGEYGLVLHCPTAGTYTVLVFDDDAVQRGTYALNLQGVSESLTCGAPIDCGDIVEGHLAVPGDVHAYTFRMEAPGAARVAVSDLLDEDPGFSANCEIYAPGGTYLGGGIQVSAFCSTPGVYTVLVFDDDAVQRGRYRLRLFTSSLRCRARRI